MRRAFTTLLTCAAIGGSVIAPAAAFAQDADGDGVPDAADAAPCDPHEVAFAFFPAEGQFGLLGFEDQWPYGSDYDFNDVVVGYNYAYHLNAAGQVTRMVATFQPRAHGAQTRSGLALHLPVATASVAAVTLSVDGATARSLTPLPDPELTVVLANDVRNLFGDRSGFINTTSGSSWVRGQPLVVTVDLLQPVAAFQTEAPHDVFIFHADEPRVEIHRSQFGGSSRMEQSLFGTDNDRSVPGNWFVDDFGFPHALSLPADAPYPAEAVSIIRGFPNFGGWVSSGGSTDADFYASGIDTRYLFTDASGRTSPPV